MAEKSTKTASLKSRPCLIAGFHQNSDTSPSYFDAYRATPEGVLSVDMVRLNLTFRSDRGEWLSRTGAQLVDCDETAGWTSKIKPGVWYELWNFKLGDSSVALGIGFIEPSCKVNMHRGFVEFNPNKVAGDKRFWRLLEKLSGCVAHAEVKRFDLAFDLQKRRMDCRLSKDRRMYKAVISNGITEYLGQKNAPGYVKVYDKAAELQLADGVELTRIELTCGGDWDAEQLEKHWPEVHGWSADGADDAPPRSRGWLRALGMLLAERAERDEEIESYVAMLDWYQKRHARGWLRTPLVELPEGAAEQLLAEAKSWERKAEGR